MTQRHLHKFQKFSYEKLAFYKKLKGICIFECFLKI